MTRRSLLKVLGGALGASSLGSSLALSPTNSSSETESLDAEDKIMTVTGPVEPGEIGTVLPHEHVFHRFGKPAARYPSYELRDLFDTVVPVLNEVQSLGCDAIMDCTAAYFGRDPLVMNRLAEITGLHLITNTGYYGAAGDRYIPDHAYDESAGRLAERWLTEWKDGVDGTGIRPGFLKTGVDEGSLSDIDAKLVRAAATIAAHTWGTAVAAREELDILDDEGVHPSAWIWVHAHTIDDLDALAEAANRGAWIEFDGLAPGDEVEHHLELVRAMQERDVLDRVLLSHDAGPYPPEGGEPTPFDTLFRTFIPRLRTAGFSDQKIHTLTVENPRKAFMVRTRT